MVDSAAVTNIPPAPETVALLGHYLYHFDTWNVPTQQPAAGEPVDVDPEAALSSQHVRALTGSKASVAAICVSGCLHAVEDDPFAAFETLGLPGITEIGVTAALASMTNLTTLHPSTIDQQEAIDYQPLAKLSLLRDLALQCCAHKPCYEGILNSNRHTLLDVTLTASTWSAATYYSLQRVEQLENLNASIRCLDVAQVQAFSKITAGHFRFALHPYVDHVLSALNGSKPAIHPLTIWAVSAFGHHSLPKLPSLQCLTLVDCALTGKDLPMFPLVTQLTLIDCPHITGQGLQHIVRSTLPAWKLYPSSLLQERCQTHSSLSAQAVNALHFGTNLHSINLRGVDGLTYKRVSDLSGVLRRKQCRSKVPHSATLSLPELHSGEGVRVVDTIQHMFVPNIFALPDH